MLPQTSLGNELRPPLHSHYSMAVKSQFLSSACWGAGSRLFFHSVCYLSKSSSGSHSLALLPPCLIAAALPFRSTEVMKLFCTTWPI
eukprot:768058-Hanusia_phi.AAC.7